MKFAREHLCRCVSCDCRRRDGMRGCVRRVPVSPQGQISKGKNPVHAAVPQRHGRRHASSDDPTVEANGVVAIASA